VRFFFALSLSFALFLAVLVPVSADPAVQLFPDEPDPISSVPSVADFKAGATDLKYAPYIGSGWFTGIVSGLGEVFLYVPVDTRGFWGTTADGYLCNVGRSTVSGVLFTSSGVQYSFSAYSFDLPRYRLVSDSGYNEWSDLRLKVTDSNMQVATDFEPDVPVSDAIPFVIVGLLGVMVLCLMRSRH
jgi:hypothetical protein